MRLNLLKISVYNYIQELWSMDEDMRGFAPVSRRLLMNTFYIYLNPVFKGLPGVCLKSPRPLSRPVWLITLFVHQVSHLFPISGIFWHNPCSNFKLPGNAFWGIGAETCN